MTISPERARLLARIQPCDLLRLDMTALGDRAVRLALISRQLGHQSVRGTVADYLAQHAGRTLEAEFAHDLFISHPEQIAERWCGSTSNAIALTMAMRSDRSL